MTRTALARQLSYRSSTVSEVFGGTKMPSRALMSAIAVHLGQDPDAWLSRWAAVLDSEGSLRDTAFAAALPGVPGVPGMPRPDRAGPRLLERDAEVRQVQALIRGAETGRSGVLVVKGEPGIGKSALLASVRPSANMVRLSVRCAENEAELAFSALSALLRPVVHLIPVLPGPQQRALQIALALRDPDPGEPSPRQMAIGMGILGLLAAAAPVVAVVDDAHWMDEASAAALSFAARRIGTEGAAVLVGVRSHEACAMDLHGHPHVELTGLSAGPARELVDRVRPDRNFDATAWARLMRWTGGNPLALIEFSRSDTPAEALRAGSSPAALPGILDRAYRKRLAPLPEGTRRALLVCAASYTGDISEITAAVGPSAQAHLEVAENAELITVAGRKVEFVHPLVRSAAYHDSTPSDRRNVHMLLARSATPEIDPDHRAWHRAEAAFGPDEQVALALDAVAERARRRGALEAVRQACRRAAELTPQPEDRARRLLAAAVGARLAGLPDEALPLLSQALDLTRDPQRVGEIQQVHQQIRQIRSEPRSVVAELAGAAATLRDEAPRAAAELLATATSAAAMGGQVGQAVAMAEEGYGLAHAATGSGTPATIVMYAYALLASGRTAEASDLLSRRNEELLAADPLAHGPEVFGYACLALTFLDEYAAADRLATLALARIASVGAAEQLSVLASGIAELRLRQGRWRAAYASAARSAALADALGQSAITGYALATLTRIEAARGSRRRCEEYAARAASILEPGGFHTVASFNRLGLAQSALAHGRYAMAAAQLESVGRRVHGSGMRTAAVIPWHGDFVEALAGANRRADAARACDAFAELADPASPPTVRAALARCRGLLAEESRAAHDHFSAALHLQVQIADPYGLARTHLAAGERFLRDRKRADADRHLSAARRLFRQTGAEPWARRAERRLGLADTGSADAERYGTLTAQEAQAAALFAEGACEEETAEALFVSVRTAESRLDAAAAKLALPSRRDLGRALR
ncbi:AAA family ATPase [Yinghuangia soli]|uniref:ATP-binding protein n=1 Tax=Yinghuangia soli TaxID=2908204 RepID=A0AA41TWT2_9ACTN|nr:ATP-binding protein [Yinghuangia soli]MCF2526153.1 ATP-binding protein [Yinghuangia soli]